MRVLAVDDDPNDLRYVRDALSAAGYRPVVTGDPEEVLRLMEEQQPQVVLLDLMLPDADGVDLMQAILEIADVPVIIVSAYGREDLVLSIQRALSRLAAGRKVVPWVRRN